MDLEFAQMLWKRDEGTHRFSIDEASLHRLVKGQNTSLARQARHRDWAELTVGVLVGLGCLYEGAFDLPGTIRWDWIALGVACWLVSGVFVRERIKSRATAPLESDSIRGSLEKSRDAVDHQIGLLTRVLWWYGLPIMIPLTVVVVGFEGFLERFRTAYIAACVALLVVIVHINCRHVRKNLVPERASIERLLKEVEGNGTV